LKRNKDDKKNSLELEGEEDVIDEEEYDILKKLKEHKKVYRDHFDQYKRLKGEVFYIQNNIDQLKESLIFNFEVWYDENFEPLAGSNEGMKPLDPGFSEN